MPSEGSPTRENFEDDAGPSALPPSTSKQPPSTLSNHNSDGVVRQRKVTVDDAAARDGLPNGRRSTSLSTARRQGSGPPQTILQRVASLAVPERKLGPEPTVKASIMAIVKASCASPLHCCLLPSLWHFDAHYCAICHFLIPGLNVLVVFIPVSVLVCGGCF